MQVNLIAADKTVNRRNNKVCNEISRRFHSTRSLRELIKYSMRQLTGILMNSGRGSQLTLRP